MKPKLRKVRRECLKEIEKQGISGQEASDYLLENMIKAKNGDYSILFSRPSEKIVEFNISCDINDPLLKLIEEELKQDEIDELITEIGKKLDPIPETIEVNLENKQNVIKKSSGRPKKKIQF